MSFKHLVSLMLCAVFSSFAWSLPDWAETALQGVNLNAPPEDAEAWQLHDEMIVSYKGNGIFEKTRYQLRYVVKDRGSSLASIIVLSSDGENAKLERIEGWHRTVHGKEHKLDRESVLTVNASNASILDNNRSTFAVFNNATKGSLIAFKTVERTESFYNFEMISLLNLMPTAKRIIKIEGGQQLEDTLIGTTGWDFKHEKNGTTWVFSDLPGRLGEPYQPPFLDLNPMMIIMAKQERTSRLASWDALAKWYYQIFTSKALAGQSVAVKQKATSSEVLTEIVGQATANLTYRQRYLSYDRGWEPISGAEVKRFAYGDCKDMTAYIAYQSAEQNLPTFPALVSVADGFRLNKDSAVLPAFNHVFAAIPVDDSVAAPAVVTVGEQRFLLADATSKYTPFGKMPASYRGLQTMICTPEGALWVKIPDAALEQEQTEISILGILDANFTFAGSIVVRERGNSYGLRNAFNFGGKRELLDRFADAMDVPGSADLEITGTEFAEDQTFVIRLQSRWPSFLRRDSGGLRLPYSIVPIGLGYLKDTAEERQMPLFISPIADVTFNINLRSAVPLEPTETSKKLSLDNRELSWEASGGNMLKIKYTRKGSQALFTKDAIEAGVKAWDGQRAPLSNFWKSGTVLDIATN